MVTGKDLYEIDGWARHVWGDPPFDGLPLWAELPPQERERWEALAHEQNLRDRTPNAHSD